jgi:hypothetical protein
MNKDQKIVLASFSNCFVVNAIDEDRISILGSGQRKLVASELSPLHGALELYTYEEAHSYAKQLANSDESRIVFLEFDYEFMNYSMLCWQEEIEEMEKKESNAE